MRCLPGADFSDLGCLQAPGIARQAGSHSGLQNSNYACLPLAALPCGQAALHINLTLPVPSPGRAGGRPAGVLRCPSAIDVRPQGPLLGPGWRASGCQQNGIGVGGVRISQIPICQVILEWPPNLGAPSAERCVQCVFGSHLARSIQNGFQACASISEPTLPR